MGLIFKKKKLTTEQDNIYKIYKARYVELARPMAGAIAVLINAMFTDIDDPEMKIKLSNHIATFICWILGEQLIHRICIYFNLYTKPNSKNPLYRNLKTLSSFGSTLGILVSFLSTSLFQQKLSISLCSLIMSPIIALTAFIIRKLGGKDESSIDAQIGTESWSKYAKTALVLGASIGQFIGGTLSYIQNNDTANSLSKITLYSAVASMVSFFAVIVFVPLINYMTRNKEEKKARGIFVADNRDTFNNNYVRAGLTLGVTIGTILGGILGPVLFPGLSASVAVAIGASAASIIGALSFGFYGKKLSAYFEKAWGVSHDTENSWSYAARSTSYFFSYMGIALAYALCPGAALMHFVMISSAIASLIGWFAGLFIMWSARQIEPDEAKMNATTLPWTQRLSTGTTKGAIIGAVAGLTIGFVNIGPWGLIGWSILLSALGAIIGGIKEILSDPTFYKFTDKTTSILFNKNYQPTDNLHRLDSKKTLNRYSLFSSQGPSQGLPRHQVNNPSVIPLI